MRPVPALVLGLVTLLLARTDPWSGRKPPPRWHRVAAAGDFAGLVDIGGRSLYMECRGSGQPHRHIGSGVSVACRLLDR